MISPKLITRTALVALFVFLIVSDLHAGVMSDRNSLYSMPKLAITGSIESRYDDYYTKTGDNSSHSYAFTEALNLNAAGFLVDRRLLNYGIGATYERSDGSGGSSDFKSFGLNMNFLPLNPFNVSLRASYSDGPGYTTKTAGVTLLYSRNVIPFNLIKSQMEQKLREQQRQQQASQQEEEGEGKNNETENQQAKEAALKEALKKYERGFLYYFLPKIYVLDFDTFSTDTSDGNQTTYSGRFSARGDYGKTNYTLSISDVYQTTNGSSSNRFSSSLSTYTLFNKWSVAGLANGAFFDKSGNASAYGLSSAINGFLTQTKKWDYSLGASYSHASGDGTTTQYSVIARTGSSSKWGKTLFSYGFASGYNRTESSDNFDTAFASANLSSNTPLSTKVSLSTSSTVTGGTGGSSYGFSISANYTPRPRLFLYATYSISGAITQNNDNSLLPDEGPLQGAAAGVSYYSKINISSVISASWSSKTESDRWDTTASTSIWGLSVVLGANLSMNRNLDSSDVGGTETRGYNFYNTITGPFLLSHSAFAVSSTYSRSDSKNLFTGIKTTTESWTVNPFITWFWRKLIITADGRYVVTDSADTRTTDRRITLRVTRPFRLL